MKKIVIALIFFNCIEIFVLQQLQQEFNCYEDIRGIFLGLAAPGYLALFLADSATNKDRMGQSLKEGLIILRYPFLRLQYPFFNNLDSGLQLFITAHQDHNLQAIQSNYLMSKIDEKIKKGLSGIYYINNPKKLGIPSLDKIIFKITPRYSHQRVNISEEEVALVKAQKNYAKHD